MVKITVNVIFFRGPPPDVKNEALHYMLTFHINTAHRSSGNSGDATFDLSAPIALKAGQKLILDTARFPLSWYNFRGKACNWKINYNSAEEAGAIEPGFYTIAGAATRLEETLRAVIPAATFTVDYALPVTGKLTITSVDDEWYDVIFQEGRLFHRLGVTADLLGEPSYDFPNFPNDGRDSYFELYIEGLSNNVASTDEANRAITFMVPLPNYSKPGDYVTYDNQGTGRCVQHEITSDRTLDRFRVSLRHTDGTIVDFNGRDWTAVFLIV